MIFAFDLDGTLCATVNGDYENAIPIPYRIEFASALFESGHTVYVHTARGASLSGPARAVLFRHTRAQLEEWGLRYTALLKKPFAHIYIDDRAAEATSFFENPEEHINGAYITEG